MSSPFSPHTEVKAFRRGITALAAPFPQVLWGTGAASSAVAAALGASKLMSSPALEIDTGGPRNLLINLAVFAATALAFVWEGCAALIILGA